MRFWYGCDVERGGVPPHPDARLCPVPTTWWSAPVIAGASGAASPALVVAEGGAVGSGAGAGLGADSVPADRLHAASATRAREERGKSRRGSAIPIHAGRIALNSPSSGS